MKLKTLKIVALLTGFLAMCSSSLFAHHGAAAYDMTKPVVLKGATVTKYSWINPHALIFLDAKDENGAVKHWTIETGSPIAIALVGWTRNTFKTGEVVTIYLYQAKTGLPVGRLNKVEFADGTVLRDTQVGGDNGERSDDGVR